MDKIMRPLDGVNFIADLGSDSGLGEWSRVTLDAVLKLGLNINYTEVSYNDERALGFSARYGNLPNSNTYPLNLLFYNLHAVAALSEEQLTRLTANKYTIANWLWETPTITEKWVPHFARVNEIWTSTRYSQTTMLQVAQTPVHVVPIPIQLEVDTTITRADFGIPEDRYAFLYTFSVGSGMVRKNPYGVISAFEKAFGRSRPGGPQLVLKAHHLYRFPEIQQELHKAVEKIDGLLIEEAITRPQMISLLNCADAYISLHRAEGFGLGMAESMYLGKPVIGTNYSGNVDFMKSDNSYLVNFTLRPIREEDNRHQPHHGDVYQPGLMVAEPDVNQAAAYMQQLVESPDNGIELGKRAAKYMRNYFSPEAVGKIIEDRIFKIADKVDLESMQDSNQRNQRWRVPTIEEVSQRPRIAYWSPMPPQKSGISDYSEELLNILDKFCEIEVFVDTDYVVDADLHARYLIHSYRLYDERNSQHPFDLNVYQMGSSFFHIYLYEQLQRVPGIVVIHDYANAYMFFRYYEAQGNLDFYEEELVYSEGELAKIGFRSVLSAPEEARELHEFWNEQHGMLRRLVESSLAQVTHLPYVAELLNAKYDTANPYVMYQGVEDIYSVLPETNPQDLRNELGIPLNHSLIGVFGLVSPQKQIEVAIRALAKLISANPNVLLLIVGGGDHEPYNIELHQLIEEHNLQDYIRFTGYVTKEELYKYLIVIDIQVNLRFPSSLQSSATLIRGICAGNPLVVTNLPEWDFYPEDFCLRVPAEDIEGEYLARHLSELLADDVRREEMSKSARNFYETQCNLPKMAADMFNIIIENFNIHQLGWARFDRPTLQGINFIGDVIGDFGIAEATRLTLDALVKSEIPVSYKPLPHPANKDRKVPDKYRTLMVAKDYDVNLIYYNIGEFAQLPSTQIFELINGKYTIVAWLWESPSIPEKWLHVFQFVDEIWTTSHYCKEIFAQYTSVPINIIPLPVRVEVSATSQRHFFNLPDNRFIFFFNFNALSGLSRKNPLAIVEAFEKAFGQSQGIPGDPLLVLKSHNLRQFPQALEAISTALHRVGGILIDQSLSRQEMNDLLACADAYISLHRAEGFGLGIAESMYLGKPIIATNYSANIDFMNQENSFPVDFYPRRIVKQDHQFQPDFVNVYPPGNTWAEPDVDHAASQIRYVFENQDIARAIGQRAAHDIIQYCSFEQVTEKIAQRLREINSNQPVHRQITQQHSEITMANRIIDPHHGKLNLENAQKTLDSWDKYRRRDRQRRISKLPILGPCVRLLTQLRNIGRMAKSQYYLSKLILTQLGHDQSRIITLADHLTHLETQISNHNSTTEKQNELLRQDYNQRLSQFDQKLSQMETRLVAMIDEYQQTLSEVRDLPVFLENDVLPVSFERVDEFLNQQLYFQEHNADNEDTFYIAHQIAFRGSEKLIQERQRRYLPYIQPIAEGQDNLPIVDIGCGRGEFIDLLRKNGFDAIGVETNEREVYRLRQLGFEAHHMDANSYLESVANLSLGGIVSFQVIEHLPPDYLKNFLKLSYQKLAPGGFILLETPNPVCPEVLSNFYLDLTHVKLIPPLLLVLLLKVYGFDEIKTLYSEPLPTQDSPNPNIISRYQDYAIVGVRK